MSITNRWIVLSLAAISVASSLFGQTAVPATISLAGSREIAPAGSITQVKVMVTEPQPISTGTGKLTTSAFSSIVGVALGDGLQDTAGVALVNGNNVSVSVQSGGSFGTSLDYPVLMVAGRITDKALNGFTVPVTLDGLSFLDPTGTPYVIGSKDGQITFADSIVVSDVIPGSASLNAGDVVSIFGQNFTPRTKVVFNHASLAETRYISPTQIDVVLAAPLSMHGQMIKVVDKTYGTDIYFSYQRTYAMQPNSVDPLLQYAMPLAGPTSQTTLGTVALDQPAGTTYGIALQNIGNLDATATIELLDASGATIGANALLVSSSRYSVRELSELFGAANVAAAAAVRVTTDNPVEILGIAADETAGTARPLIAH